MKWVGSLLASVRDGRVCSRDALYTLACALPASPERMGILRLLGLTMYREHVRIMQAQAEMDLTPEKVVDARAKRA